MIGTCSHCRIVGTVWRYRLVDVGLRFLDAGCYQRLIALGMHIEPVTMADPRQTPRFSGGLRWLGLVA